MCKDGFPCCVFLCITYTQCPGGPEKGMGFSGIGQTEGKLLCGFWEANSGPLEEQS